MNVFQFPGGGAGSWGTRVKLVTYKEKCSSLFFFPVLDSSIIFQTKAKCTLENAFCTCPWVEEGRPLGSRKTLVSVWIFFSVIQFFSNMHATLYLIAIWLYTEHDYLTLVVAFSSLAGIWEEGSNICPGCEFSFFLSFFLSFFGTPKLPRRLALLYRVVEESEPRHTTS